jgi:hypothetical protein
VEFGRDLYREVVAPRLGGLRHSAARLGPGSDVLGYDTARSTDHDWGGRLAVLVEVGEPEPLAGVPGRFRGWPTEVVVVGIGTFLTWQLGFDPRAGISTRDWLVTPQQSLASVTAGPSTTTASVSWNRCARPWPGTRATCGCGSWPASGGASPRRSISRAAPTRSATTWAAGCWSPGWPGT